jgi:hypothetical protein
MRTIYVIKLKSGKYVGYHYRYVDFADCRIYNKKGHATNSARQQNIPDKNYTVVELQVEEPM